MNPIRLLSTDFDGTLIGQPSDGLCSQALADALRDYASSGGLWAVNTGRSLEHAIEGIAEFEGPVEPDFLLTNEREVFHRGADGSWCDFGDWNQICRDVHESLFAKESGIFDAIFSHLPSNPDITVVHENGLPVGLITTDESTMETAARALLPVRDVFRDFSWQRNTIYLRFCHQRHHKGAALGELGRLTNIPAANTMAVGDHFNDLSMLSGRFAAHVACPANAIPEVKDVVRSAGGYLSHQRFGEGIADAMRAFGI